MSALSGLVKFESFSALDFFYFEQISCEGKLLFETSLDLLWLTTIAGEVQGEMGFAE